MEFFKIIDKQVSEKWIQESIQPASIGLFTETMQFLKTENHNFRGLTLWGEFLISYDKIKGGVRFTLLDCPNALSWTITTGYPPEREKIVFHCTLNRTQKSQDFIDEVNEFIDEWAVGLTEDY